MKKLTANWIHTNTPQISLKDKIIALLKIHYKLVLVQVHELQRLRVHTKVHQHANYVNYLYQHYILENNPKTYLS